MLIPEDFKGIYDDFAFDNNFGAFDSSPTLFICLILPNLQFYLFIGLSYALFVDDKIEGYLFGHGMEYYFTDVMEDSVGDYYL